MVMSATDQSRLVGGRSRQGKIRQSNKSTFKLTRTVSKPASDKRSESAKARVKIAEVSESDQGDTYSDDLLVQDRTFPEPGQPGLQMKIYQKREMYAKHIPMQHFRDKQERLDAYVETCNAPLGTLRPTQALLANMINPSTPYLGILLDAGTGVGKTITMHTVAKKFMPMVDRYGNRIIVLTPGPIISESHRDDIIKSMGIDITRLGQQGYHTRDELNAHINRYYQIVSYGVFNKMVLGEKVLGQEERELPINHIKNLDNSLLIVDEAHNIVGNTTGIAVRQLIKQSHNLKVILATATPMKNFADEIVEMINFLRPEDSQIDRNKVFTPEGYEMTFKPNGEKYFRSMIQGYVSYLRGRDPLTFAEHQEMGEILPGLDFLKVVPSTMQGLQLETYLKVDQLDSDSFHHLGKSVSLLCLPGLPAITDQKQSGIAPKLEGYYGRKGVNVIVSQLKHRGKELSQLVAQYLSVNFPSKKIPTASRVLYLDSNGRPAGKIFHLDFLDHFSCKFADALRQINRSVEGQEGLGLEFVHCKFVNAGAEMFQQVLLTNGYLEYQDKGVHGYAVKSTTRCYRCGIIKKNHEASEVKHKFYPAVFLSVTGRQDDDEVSSTKHQVIRNVYNHRDNRYGKLIKVLSGSPVVEEGVNFRNNKDTIYLTPVFTLGEADQIDGRGIRFCSHGDMINIDNLRPKVRIFKFVAIMPPSQNDGKSAGDPQGKLAVDISIYHNAEAKYRLIKQVERILAEEAIDCPLNRGGNVFPEEIERYKDCIPISDPASKEPGAQICPSVCGYQKCDYKCGDKLLNAKYYDPGRAIYRTLTKEDLDYSTYTPSLAREEIDDAKTKIRSLYSKHYVYQLDEILAFVEKAQPKHIRALFDPYYVYQALTELIPVTEDDFNQYDRPVYDKYQRPGYLIHINRYYLFQPQEEAETLPAYYRERYIPKIYCSTHVDDYLRQNEAYEKYRNQAPAPRGSKNKVRDYDFKKTKAYYGRREEAPYVGIIDSKNLVRNQDQTDQDPDEFKVRIRMPPAKKNDLKRQAGRPTEMGSVCGTSKSAEFLGKMAKSIGLSNSGTKRELLCAMIKERLHHMELYSTRKADNKVTYLIIPFNHPELPFPLNLEDRVAAILRDLQELLPEVAKADLLRQIKYRILSGDPESAIAGPLTTYRILLSWPKSLLAAKAADTLAQKYLTRAQVEQKLQYLILQ